MWQVLSAATIVAKHTSALCNACRLASSKTTNPVAKRHFVQSAKEVANSTANLVKTIKVGFLCRHCEKDSSPPRLEKTHGIDGGFWKHLSFISAHIVTSVSDLFSFWFFC